MSKSQAKPALQSSAVQRAVRRQTTEIRAAIAKMDFVCSGTMSTRTKVCGKSYCRCATDPEDRHGPYHEWTRREGGRLRHSVVSSDQAELLAAGIANYREILRLLRLWEAKTAEEVIEAQKRRS